MQQFLPNLQNGYEPKIKYKYLIFYNKYLIFIKFKLLSIDERNFIEYLKKKLKKLVK